MNFLEVQIQRAGVCCFVFCLVCSVLVFRKFWMKAPMLSGTLTAAAPATQR